MVAVVEEARGGDVDGGAEGDEGEGEGGRGRGGGLVADGDDDLGGVGSGSGFGGGGGRMVEGEGEALLAFEGRVGGVLGVGARGEEGDGDGEFGAEEEGEVEEAGPGDWVGRISVGFPFLAAVAGMGWVGGELLTGGVAAGKALEAVVENVNVSVLADGRGDEHPSLRDVLAKTTGSVLLDVGDVGLAAGE